LAITAAVSSLAEHPEPGFTEPPRGVQSPGGASSASFSDNFIFTESEAAASSSHKTGGSRVMGSNDMNKSIDSHRNTSLNPNPNPNPNPNHDVTSRSPSFGREQSLQRGSDGNPSDAGQGGMRSSSEEQGLRSVIPVKDVFAGGVEYTVYLPRHEP